MVALKAKCRQTGVCTFAERMIIIFLLLLSHTPGQFSAWTKGILIVRNAHDSPRIIAQRSSHQPDLVTRENARRTAAYVYTRRIYFPRPRQPRLLGLFVTQLLKRGLRMQERNTSMPKHTKVKKVHVGNI